MTGNKVCQINDGKTDAKPAFVGARAYLLAACCVGIALLGRFALDPVWGDKLVYVLFFLAVFIVAHFTDTGPVIFTIVASFLLGDWFFVQPRHSLYIAAVADRVNGLCFFFVGGLVLAFTRRARLALARERAALADLRRLFNELQTALAEVKTLTGLLPICAHCKKIRDDQGYWNQIEKYIMQHSRANFTHSVCPECSKEHYPSLNLDHLAQTEKRVGV
jgi:K+-sensing histidine kinase KdpD